MKLSFVLVCAALALVACSRGADQQNANAPRPSTVVAPDLRVDAVPQEEPAVARTQWRAANDFTRTATGNVSVSLAGVRGGPVVFAFATGVTTEGQPVAVTPGGTRAGVDGRSFADLLGADPRVDAHLYRVTDETIAQAARAQGGLCGQARATHLAASEFVDSRGRWVFRLVAFRGAGAPGVTGVDPQFCAAYVYEAP